MDNQQKYPQLVPVFQDLEQIIGKDTYDMWLRPAEIEFDGHTLTVFLPNQFWGKTIRERYEAIIKDAFLKHLGAAIELTYQINTEAQTPTVTSAQDVFSAQAAVPAAVKVNPFSSRLNS